MAIFIGFLVMIPALLLLLWTLYAMVRIIVSKLKIQKKLLWLLLLLLSGPVGAVLWFTLGQARSPSSPST